jgi:hypothetical protein
MAQIKTPNEWLLERKVQELVKSTKTTKRNVPVEKRLEQLEGWTANLGDVLKMLIVPRAS